MNIFCDFCVLTYNVTMYAFVHVLKTGGTSIKDPIRSQLCLSAVKGSPPQQHKPTSWFDKHSHDHIFMTMIRDPYDRAVSEYFYIQRQMLNKIDDIHQWSERQKISHSYLTKVSLETFLEYHLPKSTYMYYFDSRNIEDFDFVGYTYDMQTSVNLANHMFNLKTRNQETNVNPEHKISTSYECKYSRNDFYKKYEQDYEVYVKGKEKFKNLCRKYNVGTMV